MEKNAHKKNKHFFEKKNKEKILIINANKK